MSVRMALIHVIAFRQVASQPAPAQTDRGGDAVRCGWRREAVSNTEPVKPAAERCRDPLCLSREMPSYKT